MHLYLLFVYLYWLLIFAVHRLIFVIVNAGVVDPRELSLGNFAGSFIHGMKLDFSMAAYATIIAWLFMLLSLPLPKKPARTAVNAVTAVLIVLGAVSIGLLLFER